MCLLHVPWSPLDMLIWELFWYGPVPNIHNFQRPSHGRIHWVHGITHTRSNVNSQSSHGTNPTRTRFTQLSLKGLQLSFMNICLGKGTMTKSLNPSWTYVLHEHGVWYVDFTHIHLSFHDTYWLERWSTSRYTTTICQ